MDDFEDWDWTPVPPPLYHKSGLPKGWKQRTDRYVNAHNSHDDHGLDGPTLEPSRAGTRCRNSKRAADTKPVPVPATNHVVNAKRARARARKKATEQRTGDQPKAKATQPGEGDPMDAMSHETSLPSSSGTAPTSTSTHVPSGTASTSSHVPSGTASTASAVHTDAPQGDAMDTDDGYGYGDGYAAGLDGEAGTDDRMKQAKERAKERRAERKQALHAGWEHSRPLLFDAYLCSVAPPMDGQQCEYCDRDIAAAVRCMDCHGESRHLMCWLCDKYFHPNAHFHQRQVWHNGCFEDIAASTVPSDPKDAPPGQSPPLVHGVPKHFPTMTSTCRNCNECSWFDFKSTSDLEVTSANGVHMFKLCDAVCRGCQRRQPQGLQDLLELGLMPACTSPVALDPGPGDGDPHPIHPSDLLPFGSFHTPGKVLRAVRMRDLQWLWAVKGCAPGTSSKAVFDAMSRLQAEPLAREIRGKHAESLSRCLNEYQGLITEARKWGCQEDPLVCPPCSIVGASHVHVDGLHKINQFFNSKFGVAPQEWRDPYFEDGFLMPVARSEEIREKFELLMDPKAAKKKEDTGAGAGGGEGCWSNFKAAKQSSKKGRTLKKSGLHIVTCRHDHSSKACAYTNGVSERYGHTMALLLHHLPAIDNVNFLSSDTACTHRPNMERFFNYIHSTPEQLKEKHNMPDERIEAAQWFHKEFKQARSAHHIHTAPHVCAVNVPLCVCVALAWH